MGLDFYRGCRLRLFQDQKRGARAGPPLPGAPGITRGFTGKTLRAIRNDWTNYVEQHPEELSKFPEQMFKAAEANALHLGGDENTPVDPAKECYPAGQGVGAIGELESAGDIVRRIVDEAGHALARAAATVVR